MRALVTPLALLLAAAPAYGLRVVEAEGVLRVTNDGPAPVVALRVGERTFARLDPGETVEAPAGLVAGRFDPADWAAALDDLDPRWADLHLRTAGHFLDVISPGAPGVPRESANLRLLAGADPAVAASWAAGSPLRLTLAARAARHVPPGPLLDALLAAASPDGAPAALPAAYAALMSLPDELRRAVEAHGAAAVPVLLAHPAWAADRGFADRALAAAFGIEAPATADPAALVQALERGEHDAAAREAVRAAVAWRSETPHPLPVEARLVCGGLDLGAQADLAAGRFTAAEARLRLAGAWCGDAAPYRQRIAALLRARGDVAHRGADLHTAAAWFRAAWAFAREPADRARLADTLADLATLQFADGDTERGRGFLDEARTIDDARPKVMEAMQARPEVDSRARAGILLIIVFLGLFIVRRLRRVLRRPRSPGDFRS